MATQSTVRHRLGLLRVALTGALTAAFVFVLCWLGTFIAFSSPTHAYIGLFTPVEVNTFAALCQGSAWSFLFGGLFGVLLAWVYNMLSGLEPS